MGGMAESEKARLLLIVLAGCFANTVHAGCSEVIDFSFDLYGEDMVNPFGNCSGQGECVDNSTRCECNEGWTGLSEFVNTEGNDCQINILAVKLLWGYDVFLGILLFGFGAPRVYTRYEAFLERQRRAKNIGETITLWQTRPLLACFVIFGGCIPSVVILGLIRIIDDNERVGVTVLSTVFFISGKVTMYTGTFLFQPALFELFVKSSMRQVSPELQRLVQISNVGGLIFCFVSIGLGCVSIATLLFPENAATYYFGYLVGQCAAMLWYGLQAVAIKMRVNEVLGKMRTNTSLRDLGAASTNLVQTRINQMQNEILLQTSVQFVSFAVLLFVPVLYNKHDYYLPVSWIALIWLGYKLAWTHVGQGDKYEDSQVTRQASKLLSTVTRGLGSKAARGSKEILDSDRDSKDKSKLGTNEDSKEESKVSKNTTGEESESVPLTKTVVLNDGDGDDTV